MDHMKTFRLLAAVLFLTVMTHDTEAKRKMELVYFDGHLHTTHSDGTGTIADIKTVAKARGLNAVFVTNHAYQITSMAEWLDIVTTCMSLSEKDFFMIPSFEVTGMEGLFCRDHMLAWGVYNPFIGNPALGITPEEKWESPVNPFGTGPMYPGVLTQWANWIHRKGGIAVHAHTVGTTQLSYNVDYIEVINIAQIKDVARFAQMAGFNAADAWNLGVLLNSFAVYGDRYLQMPVNMPNPYYGLPGQPATIELPLQQAIYLGTSMIGDVGENTGGAQWIGPNTPQALLDAGATPSAALNSWDDLLMAYVNHQINHPIFAVANTDAHNTANVIIGSTEYDDSDVGEAKNGVYLPCLNPGQLFHAIRRGNLFATTGPSVYFDVNGQMMGETVKIRRPRVNDPGHGKDKHNPRRDTPVTLTLSSNSQSAAAIIVKIDIIKNGEVMQTSYPMAGEVEFELEDPVTQDGYYRVEITAMDSISGRYQFAYTNPVFVEVQ
jgi:hypothetical protein